MPDATADRLRQSEQDRPATDRPATPWWVAAALGVIILLSYASSFQTGFPSDNRPMILDDQRLRQVSVENLNLMLTQHLIWPLPYPWSYRPLTTLSLWFNYAVLGNGDQPAGYHWFNFLLQWGNAFLLYLLVWQLTRERAIAFFSALLFGVHPIGTDVVTNIIGRSDLFAAGAVLGGLLLYIRANSASAKDRPRWLLRLAILFTLGLCGKENSIMLIGVLALYDFTYRLQPKHPRWLLNLALNFREFFIRGYVVLLLPLLLFFGVRTWVLARSAMADQSLIVNPLLVADAWSARLTAIKVIGKQFALLLWPQALTCDYAFNQVPLVHWPFASWEDWKTVVALAAILIWLTVALACYRRHKAVFFFSGFYFLLLLPTSNLLVLTSNLRLLVAIMAERYIYLPSVGFLTCAVIGIYQSVRWLQARASSNPGTIRWLGFLPPVLLSCAALACGLRTYERNFDWKDNATLWGSVYRVCPDNIRGLLLGAPKDDPAVRDRLIGLLEELNELSHHRDFEVQWTLGEQYRKKGDSLAAHPDADRVVVTPESRPWYEKAVAILSPLVPQERALNQQSRQRELSHGKDPKEIYDLPFGKFYADLGVSYLRLNRYQEALETYSYIQQIAPGSPEAYRGMAAAQDGLGQTEAAAANRARANERSHPPAKNRPQPAPATDSPKPGQPRQS